MTVEIFVRIVSTVFDKTEKVHKWLFLGQFWLFLESQPYDVDLIAHIEPPHSVKKLYKFAFESYRVFERTSICFKMTVENFFRIVSTVFDKIEKLHKWLFLRQFRLFIESQPYDVDLIAHIGPP